MRKIAAQRAQRQKELADGDVSRDLERQKELAASDRRRRLRTGASGVADVLQRLRDEQLARVANATS